MNDLLSAVFRVLIDLCTASRVVSDDDWIPERFGRYRENNEDR